MKDEIEKAIKELIKQIHPTMDGGEALRITQAMLNLAHTATVLKENKTW